MTEDRWRVALPDLSIDMDGVLCRPPLWFNLVISRDIRHEPDTRLRPRLGDARLPGALAARILDSHAVQLVRYDLRRPMPEVAAGLAALAEVRRLVLLSGRPRSALKATERWLIRHGLRDFFSEIVLNDRGLSNAAFKLTVVRERDIRQHVDDDGRVAYFLSRDEPRSVFLIAWRRNRGLPYPPTVHRVRNLLEVALLLRGENSPMVDSIGPVAT
ncbi:MAG: hypothetical protein IRY83_05090 [Chloroflexi bacterium]|nr:hypothetical protein [Chloroflexota bacterium]